MGPVHLLARDRRQYVTGLGDERSRIVRGVVASVCVYHAHRDIHRLGRRTGALVISGGLAHRFRQKTGG